MTASDTLYVVHLPGNAGMITCTDEAKARAAHAARPGSTLGARPFPSPVKMPRIDSADLVTGRDRAGYLTLTYPPLGVSGWGDDHYEAYGNLLRAVREHLEAATETPIA